MHRKMKRPAHSHSLRKLFLISSNFWNYAIRMLLGAGGPPMSNTVPSEYYWRTRNVDTNHQNTISRWEDHQSRTQCRQKTIRGRNADTNHQNTISGREDRESRTQCHQNTIGGRAMPTPVIRILLAGGRTTNVEHNADFFFSVRRLLGSRQVVTQCLCQLNEFWNTVPSEYY